MNGFEQLIDSALIAPVKGFAAQVRARPFVKWVGGKRSLIPKILPCLPDQINHYHEPFVGGGALFYTIESQLSRAFLSDMNAELMMTYKIVATRCDELIKQLEHHAARHNNKYYMTVRKREKIDCPVERAARFIYLNKTCYNGLYRVNKAGKFNVPPGSYKNPQIVDRDNLKAVSAVLSIADLKWQGFDSIKPVAGDFVYCDPPYNEAYNNYTELRFNGAEQKLLSDTATDWHKQGVNVMLSNSDTPMIREFYKARHWRINEVMAARSISCKGNERMKVPEVIITNYDP